MDHILSRATNADIRLDPFPHVVIRDAIDPSLAQRLTHEFPSTSTIAQGVQWRGNQRFSLPFAKARHNDGVSDIWRQFLALHVGREFFDSFVGLFGAHAVESYPQFASSIEDLQSKRLGLREVDDWVECDIALDALPSVNTPVQGRPSSVRTAHVDDPRKLLTGLFYLRAPEDDSQGGDLVLYRYRKGKYYFENQMIDDRYIEKVITIPYASNVAVVFPNSLYALHGVTPRYPTSHRRIFMNLIGDTQRPLFDLSRHQYPRWWRLARRMKRFAFGAPDGFYK